MKYSILLRPTITGSRRGQARTGNKGSDKHSSGVTIVIADVSDAVRNWLCELLRARREWMVRTSPVSPSSIAKRLQEFGRNIVIIGSPDPAVALDIAEEVRSLHPDTRVILFLDFNSCNGKDRARKQTHQIVPRNTALVGGVLAAVENLLSRYDLHNRE